MALLHAAALASVLCTHRSNDHAADLGAFLVANSCLLGFPFSYSPSHSDSLQVNKESQQIKLGRDRDIEAQLAFLISFNVTQYVGSPKLGSFIVSRGDLSDPQKLSLLLIAALAGHVFDSSQGVYLHSTPFDSYVAYSASLPLCGNLPSCIVFCVFVSAPIIPVPSTHTLLSNLYSKSPLAKPKHLKQLVKSIQTLISAVSSLKVVDETYPLHCLVFGLLLLLASASTPVSIDNLDVESALNAYKSKHLAMSLYVYSFVVIFPCHHLLL